MLRKFAAALVATTLIAGSAFAAQSSGTNGAPATPAMQAAPVNAGLAKTVTPVNAGPAKTVTPVKHAATHSRRHVVRKTGTMHQARALKSARSHQAKIGHKATTSVKNEGNRPRA